MTNWSDYLNYFIRLVIRIINVAFLAFILLSASYAQQNLPQNADSTQNDTLFVMQKSPLGAVLRSAVIPGWGQIYNHSYLKAPVIWGIAGWLVYGWIQNNNNYKVFRDAYLKNQNLTLKTNRDFYRDQRDLFAIYLGLTYVLNLVDAYVDAELFDFNVKENIRTNTPMLDLQINF